jgi:protein-S-isoprenylcysteine O-methyltransferase Ste14
MSSYILNATAGLVASCLVAYATSPPQQVDDSDQRTKESVILSGLTRVTAFTSTAMFVGPQLGQLALAYLQSRPCAPSRDLGLLDASEWAGIALQAAGALLRIWCFRVLGRYFTCASPGHRLGYGLRRAAVEVTIRKVGWIRLASFVMRLMLRAQEHKLVRAPPYSHVRHPSYTGITLVALGTILRLVGPHSALVQFGYVPHWAWSPWTAVAVATLHTAAVAERIRGEEASLARAFPREWPEYVRETWRLLPGIL